MSIQGQEFTIKSRKKDKFRIAKISPVDLLALTTQIDLSNFQQTKVIFTFALEHIEVKVAETWMPVKVVGREVYQPSGIEEDMNAMNELVMYFLNEVIAKTFTQSSK